jgi:alanine racemase
MDNITFEVDARSTRVYDDVVLIGAQGAQRVTAEELARRMDTINYEVTCGLSRRVPREHHRDGEAADR